MASEYDTGNPADRPLPGQLPADYPGPGDQPPLGEGLRQDGGHRTPDSQHRLKMAGSAPGTPAGPTGSWDMEPRKSSERSRSTHTDGVGTTLEDTKA